MLFGGKLASIIVCDTCKKVSLTHEDFNDLSLSIKPEDYVKSRKRDRFKHLAKKLRLKPKELDAKSSGGHRASSVPASPARRSMDPQPHNEEPPINVDHRRRSFDHVQGSNAGEEDHVAEARNSVRDLAETLVGEAKASALPAQPVEDSEAEPERIARTPTHIAFSEAVKDKSDSDRKREKEDGWGKLSRRLSISMGMSKKEKRMSRSRDRGWKSWNSKDSDLSRPPSEERLPPSLSAARLSTPQTEVTSATSDLSDTRKSRPVTPSPVASPLSTPPLNISSPLPNFRRHSAMSVVEKPLKPTRPPKPSRQEAAYLRRLLADVHPTPSTFTMLQQAISGGSQNGSVPSSPVMSAQALLAKLGHMPGIEECLRLFTAVEVLDGENMVGCHRCWKIANGTYKPRRAEGEDEKDDSEESLDSPVLVPDAEVLAAQMAERDARDSSPENPGRISPVSTSFLSGSAASSSIFLQDTASISSAPTTIQSVPPDIKPVAITGVLSASSDSQNPPIASYGGLPIPSISTTEPDSPSSVPDTARPPPTPLPNSAVTSSSSLVPPQIKKRKHLRQNRGSDSSSEDDYDSSSSSGDESGYSDASSAASTTASPSGSRRTSLEAQPSASAHSNQPAGERKIPKSQQVVMRRTFKRYLIAVPPPILVIHLKRFQQVSKSNPYAMAFSSGFKKLDDFVAFPEYLDVAPFLAPSKAEFRLTSKRNPKPRPKEERCMYRLYAVVVHIGNMVSLIS